MKDEKEAQKLYLELRMLTNHIKEMQQRMQLVEEQSMHLVEVMESLDELSQVKAGTRALVPISEGIFFPAAVAEGDSLIVNVGAEVGVRKNVHDTKMLLSSKLDELRHHRDELAQELERAVSAAREAEGQLMVMLKDEQGKEST